jgi:hypothetical protein
VSPVRTNDSWPQKVVSISHSSTILLIPTRFAARGIADALKAAASGVNRSIAPDHARGQPAVLVPSQICGDHQFQPQPRGVSQHGARDSAVWDQSTLDSVRAMAPL